MGWTTKGIAAIFAEEINFCNSLGVRLAGAELSTKMWHSMIQEVAAVGVVYHSPADESLGSEARNMFFGVPVRINPELETHQIKFIREEFARKVP